MMRPAPLWVIPALALVLLSGILGLRVGRPVSDTAIIDRYARDYVRQTGGQATDCAATPHPSPGVRMVIACAAPGAEPVIFHAGPRGAPVPQPAGPAA